MSRGGKGQDIGKETTSDRENKMNSYKVDDIFRLKKPKGGYRVWRVIECNYGATDQESVIILEPLDLCKANCITAVPVIMMEQMEWIDPVKQLD